MIFHHKIWIPGRGELLKAGATILQSWLYVSDGLPSQFILLLLLHLKEHQCIPPLGFITDDVQLLENSGEFKPSVQYRPICSVMFKLCYWMDLFSI